MMKELNKMIPLIDVVLFLDEKMRIAQDLIIEVEGEARKAAYQYLNALIALDYELYEKFSNKGDE